MTLHGSRDTAELLQAYASTPERLEAIVEGATDEALDFAPPGEWSACTILAHLRDDEFMCLRVRVERMVVEDDPELAPFDEKAWAASRYTGRDALPELLADFRVQRDASLMILSRLSPADWRRTGRQPEYGHFDVHWWMEHRLKHDEMHLDQLRRTLQAAPSR
jgi:hypothetical protein